MLVYITHGQQYNGKELLDELNLNLHYYGARMYDPAIGRFTGVDPISDQFPHVSTFNYAENEPIANIDLHGLQKKNSTTSQNIQGSAYSNSFEYKEQKAGGGSGSVRAIGGSAYNNTNSSSISLGAEASLISGEASARFGGYDNVAIVADGEGSLLSVEANFDGGIFTGNGGKYGAMFDANLGAYTAEGEVSTGVALGPLKFQAVYGGSLASAHAGATGSIYFDENTGQLVIEGLEHLGFGAGEKAGFKVTLQISDPKEEQPAAVETCDDSCIDDK